MCKGAYSKRGTMDIWQLQQRISRHLLFWSAISFFAGSWFLFSSKPPLLQGIGVQAIIWSIVNAVIAWFAGRSTQRRKAGLAQPHSAAVMQAETQRLRRLLLINAGLDVGYMAIGILIIATLGRGSAFAQGNGWGVVIQGAFLLFFDGFYSWRSLNLPDSAAEPRAKPESDQQPKPEV